MIKVVINLDSDDKDWLQHIAKDENISMAKVIRQAISHYRLKKLLSKTKGTWKQGNSLVYQRKIRSEWKKR